jgi:hypothetical protein
MSQRSQSRQSPSGPFPRFRGFPSPSSTCGHCGHAYAHPQGQSSCPARGSQCRLCGKMNHFVRCCRSINLSDHRLLKVAPLVFNRVFNHPLLTPFHVNPLHARFATLPTLNNTLSLRMSIFSQ